MELSLSKMEKTVRRVSLQKETEVLSLRQVKFEISLAIQLKTSSRQLDIQTCIEKGSGW